MFIAGVSLHAQDNDANDPLVESGSFAFTFQMNGFGDFGVTGVQTGSTPILLGTDPGDPIVFAPLFGIGVKAFVSDEIAIRGALGVNYNSVSTETVITPDSTVSRTDDAFASGVAAGMEYHFPQAGPVSGYAGLFVSYAGNVITRGPEDAQVSESGSTFSVGPIFGAEVFPWDNVSLGLEYLLGFGFGSTSMKVGDNETDGPSTTQIGTGAVAVKASLYIK